MNTTLADTIEGRIAELNARPGRAGRVSARSVSMAATGRPDVVRKILDGSTVSPRADTLVALERALELPPGTLVALVGGGAATPAQAAGPAGEVSAAPVEPPDTLRLPRDVPVLGTALGGAAGSFEFNGEIVDYVRRPPALVAVRGLYAIYVVGSSMEPEHRQGDLRFVHPGKPAGIGDSVVIQVRAHEHAPIEAYIKHLARRTAVAIHAEQLNPKAAIDFRLSHVVAVHKVLTLNELFGL